MPTPQYIETDYDPWEMPHTPSEILGRGASSRKSKTLISDHAERFQLALIAAHSKRLLELFRHCHAAHYQVDVVEEDEDGTKRIVSRPEVLSDDEIRATYSVVAEWERMHAEQVDHAVSVGGFSIKSATGSEDVERKRRNQASSAGADRQEGREPRWQ